GFFFVLAYSWMPTAFSLPLKWTPLFLLLGLLQFIFVNKKQYNELPIFLTGFVSIIILIVNIIFK
ncbi:MAG: hypothetical protein NT091_02665, partial [Candidatus Falkowbacteria bacterium]|nr:hypothetical protein [Candidatus Falkowbacteria bacterium]